MTSAPAQADRPSLLRSATVIILAGCAVSLIGFGPRSVMGLFLEPMTVERGFSRETFGLAMAIQNLLWGAGVPIAGALADRFGPARVLALGAVMYALGLWGMAEATSGVGLHLFGGLLTGLGVAFASFSIALASIARAVGPARRSLALGLGTAAGSLGQVLFSPLTQGMIGQLGWHDSLTILALVVLAIIPLAVLLPGDPGGGGRQAAEQTIGEALREAVGHRGFVLLTSGFFVCGFQVAFITVHFPAYVKDLGFDPAIGAAAMALVGLFNIAGSFGAGWIGQRYSKRYGLSLIYLLRSVAVTAMLLLPKTEAGMLVFAAVMGVLWLSTVPLTSGIVAQVFGVRYMATLFGIVFFSHQIGSFLGVWLGGLVYDRMGTYDPVWWMGVALGVVAALVHLPIDDRPLARLETRPTAAA
ncbi:MAG: MFS transporter [Hyphomicrobiaceae bacterium]